MSLLLWDPWLACYKNTSVSRSRKVDLVSFIFLSDFYFLFNLFLCFLFIALRVRVRVMTGHDHKSRNMMEGSRRF